MPPPRRDRSPPARRVAPARNHAGKTVIVKHLLSGDNRVHHDGECIACAPKQFVE